MKKTVFAVVFALFGTQAAFADMVAQNERGVRDYKVAIAQAVRATRLTCTQVEPRDTESIDVSLEYLRQAREVWVDTSGAQPAIITSAPHNSRYRTLLRIVTTADYTQIVSLSQEGQALTEVNISATIIPPKIESQWVTQKTVNCVR